MEPMDLSRIQKIPNDDITCHWRPKLGPNGILHRAESNATSSFAVLHVAVTGDDHVSGSASLFFLKKKEIGFIADGWLQRVHNLGSVTTVPVTSYIEVLQNVDLYLFNGGGSEV